MFPLPISLHRLNEMMRGKPGFFVLVTHSTITGPMVMAIAASATDLTTKGSCPSTQPEIRYVGEMTANVLE